MPTLKQRLARLAVALAITTTSVVAVNVTAAGPAAADACYTWTRELVQGMSGEDVRQLQIRVAGWAASQDEILSIDGHFGARTEAAVRRFQAAYGLGVDGRFGPQSQNRMYQLQDDDCTPIHFSFAELTASEQCGSQASLTGGSVPPAQVRENLLQTMWRAEALRRQLGDSPLPVNSGFRSIECNQDVGGAGDSMHTYGRAIDLANSCTIAQQARWAGFSTIIYEGDHVHLDTRSRSTPHRSGGCGL